MNTIENTPAHCHSCSQFVDCRQAQHMVADTPPEDGFIFEGEVYCTQCLGVNDDRIPFEGESDTPLHCGDCGVPIIHGLTIEGVEYVRVLLRDGNGCSAEVWPTVWADYLG